jgi:hypothetical protein
LPRLRAHLAAGGQLLAVRPPSFYVDGETSEILKDFEKEYAGQVHLFDEARNLLERVAQLVPPRLEFCDTIPKTGIAHMHRFIDGDELFLIVNSSMEHLSYLVHISRMSCWTRGQAR